MNYFTDEDEKVFTERLEKNFDKGVIEIFAKHALKAVNETMDETTDIWERIENEINPNNWPEALSEMKIIIQKAVENVTAKALYSEEAETNA